LSFINNAIVSIVRKMPKSVVWIFSKKYIAGESLSDAVELVKWLNQKGIYGTLDVLGEAITTKEEAIHFKDEGLAVLDEIDKNKLLANLSLKPTQMGLAINEELAYDLIYELAEKAKKINNFIRLDMEDSPYTDAIINLYKRLRKTHDNVGIVLQAYLHRTFGDIVELNKMNANYRLCKGIYVEPEEIAFKGKKEIRDNFLKCLNQILKDGCYAGIATHDEYLINESYKMINEMKIAEDKYEFQMLLGVTEELRDKINSGGHKIRIYIPYGEDWYLYSIRRLKENPQIAGQIFRNIFSFKS
jgi:proline dehydrogenase